MPIAQQNIVTSYLTTKRIQAMRVVMRQAEKMARNFYDGEKHIYIASKGVKSRI